MSLKLSLCAIAVAAIASGSVAPAEARDLSNGAAAAVGVLGGLALGGGIAAGTAQGAYYPGRQVAGPAPVYVAPPPPRTVYVEEAPVERCFVRTRRFENEWGDVVVRRQRVCE